MDIHSTVAEILNELTLGYVPDQVASFVSLMAEERDLKQRHEEAEDKLKGAIRQFNKANCEAFLDRLTKAGKAWCDNCDKLVDLAIMLGPIYSTHYAKQDCGYEDSEWRVAQCSNYFVQICANCYAHKEQMNGAICHLDKETRDTRCFRLYAGRLNDLGEAEYLDGKEWRSISYGRDNYYHGRLPSYSVMHENIELRKFDPPYELCWFGNPPRISYSGQLLDNVEKIA